MHDNVWFIIALPTLSYIIHIPYWIERQLINLMEPQVATNWVSQPIDSYEAGID
jgi:hypothetical protein